MNKKSVERVVSIIENSCCSVDLQWRNKLLRKHENCHALEASAQRCFGGHGRVIAKELMQILKEEDILEDFIQDGVSSK